MIVVLVPVTVVLDSVPVVVVDVVAVVVVTVVVVVVAVVVVHSESRLKCCQPSRASTVISSLPAVPILHAFWLSL